VTERTKKTALILLLIGIVILGIMNLKLGSRINNLEMTLQSVNNLLNSDIRELYSMQQDISNKIDSMNEQAIQNAKLSFDEETFIKDYHESTSSVDVNISFGLKQFNADDIVNVTARGTNGTFEAVTTPSGAGRFHTTMTLPVQDNYTLTFTLNGASSMSGELTKLSLADEFCERFKYSFGTRQTSGSDQRQINVMLYPEFANNTQGNAALKIKELSLIVESGSTVVGTWDLLPYLRDEANSQIINDYQEQLQLAAGEIPALNEGDTSQNLIEFSMPDDGAIARLVITDNMGIRYEQTDRVYAGSSPNSGAGGGVGYSYVPPRIAEDGEYGDGYIHIVQQR